MRDIDDQRGFLRELVGDGRPALGLTAVVLFLSGAFAIFLAIRREFLPQDITFLGMTAKDLCAIADCRIVRFMFHDRVAFGGTLIAVAFAPHPTLRHDASSLGRAGFGTCRMRWTRSCVR